MKIRHSLSAKLLATLALVTLVSCASQERLLARGETQHATVAYQAVRFAQNPIITPAMLGEDGTNINGPSLIRAPEWLPNKLGKYYLYFAHHEGQYLRLAYADDLRGPWKIHTPGVIPTQDLSWKPDHIASPDVLVDEDRHEIRLYFHSPVTPAPKSSDPDYLEKLLQTKQDSFVATSKDGLHFNVKPQSLGPSYFRVWQSRGYYYALPRLAMPLFRSKDGFAPFEKTKSPFEYDSAYKQIRHVAVLQETDGVTVFYSRIGDAPERIMMTKVAMAEDWSAWKAGTPVELMRPENGYEGYGLPIGPSLRGSSTKPENGLRDPAIFQEDGKIYMLYSVEGEKGIGIAELVRH